MHLNYKLESKHYDDFCIARSRELLHVNGRQGQRIWELVVGSIIAALGIAAWRITGSEIAYLAFFTGAWTFWLINKITDTVLARRAVTRIFREDGLVLGNRSLSVDDGGVHVASDLLKEEVSWKLIRSVSLQRLVLVLWTDPAAGIIIARSAFTNAKQEQEFISLVQSKIG